MPFGLSAPEINVTLGAGDSNVCTNTLCKKEFQETTNMLALYYSVSVFAKNLLMNGYSEGQMCSYRTSEKNVILKTYYSGQSTNVMHRHCTWTSMARFVPCHYVSCVMFYKFKICTTC